MCAKRADAEKNRERLLLAARALIQAGQTTLAFNELAKHARVGVGTVYRHFSNQAALMAGLAETQLAELESLMARAREEKNPLVALDLLLRGTMALELDSPVMAQLLAAPQPQSRELMKQLTMLESTAELILSRGRKAKVVRADVRAGDLRRLVCGLELAVRSGDKKEEAAARYVDIVLMGLRRRRAHEI